MRACMHTHVRAYIHACVRTCMHSYRHTRPGADVAGGEPSCGAGVVRVPNPGADVGRGEPSPGADVANRMQARISDLFRHTWLHGADKHGDSLFLGELPHSLAVAVQAPLPHLRRVWAHRCLILSGTACAVRTQRRTPPASASSGPHSAAAASGGIGLRH